MTRNLWVCPPPVVPALPGPPHVAPAPQPHITAAELFRTHMCCSLESALTSGTWPIPLLHTERLAFMIKLLTC